MVTNNTVLENLDFTELWNQNKASIEKEASYLEEEVHSSYEPTVSTRLSKSYLNPSAQKVKVVLDMLFGLVFPEYVLYSLDAPIRISTKEEIREFYCLLSEQVLKALISQKNNQFDINNQLSYSREIVFHVICNIPTIRSYMMEAVEAAYRGDPAAPNYTEIILSYPFIKALTVHQLAHMLYLKKIPCIPRLLSEWAHSETGIDIHPGAEIGKGFFIDHGTGVVIGETTVIGDNVKIYQGVTLGALSFEKDKNGELIKGTQRHPTLEDNVVVYANATILGGNTVIGHDCVIGGNTWIVESVEPNTIVTLENPKLKYRTR